MGSINVILTTYFTGKPDPQIRSKRKMGLIRRVKTWYRSRRGGASAEPRGTVMPDNFERIYVWYHSLIRVGCNGVIFHDQLSPAFVEERATPQIEFERYELKTQRSVNDERYLCYLEWLEAHPDVERIFLTDLFDIEFFSDPFAVMDDSRYDIYSGGDPGEHNDKLNRKKMIRAFGEPHYENEIKLNAGTCGAPRAAMLRLLKSMVETFDDLTARGIPDNLNFTGQNYFLLLPFPK